MPLRIVIDTRHIKDFGIGTYIRNLLRALATLDRENHYVLVTFKESLGELAGLPSNFVPVVYGRSDSDPLDQIAFSLFLRHFSADLVHIPLNVVPLAMPKPYVLTVHDMSSLLFDDQPGLRKKFRLYQFRRGLLRADRVIAVSAATRRDIEDLFGISTEQVRLVYNAPDPKFVERAASSEDKISEPGAQPPHLRSILERYQIDYPFLLYAGAIRAQKNIPRLVEAFAVVRGDLETHRVYKDLRLIIIGDEISRHPAVRFAVIRTRVEQVVRFLGFVPLDTLRVFYEAASAFVFPSLYEGFGLPPLEAMASGTPVVCSNLSSHPEVVGEAAVLVNPENVFYISRGIREVLTNESLRGTLIGKGYEQARRFSWESTARQVLDIYGEVARSRGFRH
jgi:glycosyltransferase involved in cell wall biosynthesis